MTSSSGRGSTHGSPRARAAFLDYTDDAMIGSFFGIPGADVVRDWLAQMEADDPAWASVEP